MLDPECKTDNYDEVGEVAWLHVRRTTPASSLGLLSWQTALQFCSMGAKLFFVCVNQRRVQVLGDASWSNANLTTTRDIIRIKMRFGRNETGTVASASENKAGVE